jgi:hypothetical protein
MKSFMGMASWAKMTSLGGKLTTLVCHPTKKVNKAEELTHLSANIGGYLLAQKCFPGTNTLAYCVSKRRKVFQV